MEASYGVVRGIAVRLPLLFLQVARTACAGVVHGQATGAALAAEARGQAGIKGVSKRAAVSEAWGETAAMIAAITPRAH